MLGTSLVYYAMFFFEHGKYRLAALPLQRGLYSVDFKGSRKLAHKALLEPQVSSVPVAAFHLVVLAFLLGRQMGLAMGDVSSCIQDATCGSGSCNYLASPVNVHPQQPHLPRSKLSSRDSSLLCSATTARALSSERHPAVHAHSSHLPPTAAIQTGRQLRVSTSDLAITPSYASPERRCSEPEKLGCDGECVYAKMPGPHVVSLSACADLETAWEGWNEIKSRHESMTTVCVIYQSHRAMPQLEALDAGID
jgi:hypothetical protein